MSVVPFQYSFEIITEDIEELVRRLIDAFNILLKSSIYRENRPVLEGRPIFQYSFEIIRWVGFCFGF